MTWFRDLKLDDVARLAVIMLVLTSCQMGADPSPDPTKPCPAGMVRHVANITPVFACYRDDR